MGLDLLASFQSTRPVWGATTMPDALSHSAHVSIHAPRVGRDAICPSNLHALQSFNPRAPCGARRGSRRTERSRQRFQSTRPVWGATNWSSYQFTRKGVSIHAPRVGRDSIYRHASPRSKRFNPRAPCGARQRTITETDGTLKFQSTRPVWGATIYSAATKRDQAFQSTRPVWGATVGHVGIVSGRDVSIHAPRVGRDQQGGCQHGYVFSFNPRAPCGARPCLASSLYTSCSFNPRAPCGARHPEVGREGQDPRFNPRAPCGARPP